MRPLVRICLLLAWLAGPAWAQITPPAVAVLYNASSPDSKKLAETYQKARNIPAENLIGLAMPAAQDISRADYEKTILAPLRGEFDRRGWWKRQASADGGRLPVENRIQVLVMMRGVPLRITPTPKPAAAADPKNPTANRDEAAVDSELAMFGVEGLPTDSVLQNKYYQSTVSFDRAAMPFMVLTARIDAPSFETCERIIGDAVEAEKTGLWGRAYVDIANKYPEGDQWLETVVKANRAAGIPTVVDRFNETLPRNYPMTDASVYFGWYDWNVSGPFLSSKFWFRRGAVAVHLHSFSAEQLSDSSKNWCGPLLQRGAAVTLGNVYEPYLGLTHNLGIVQERLLAGFSWGEACWMAMPVTSWQGVVLGDPLYRPFLRRDGSGVVAPADVEFRALRAAAIEWREDTKERRTQLEKAAERMKSGILAEAVGLELVETGRLQDAVPWFQAAKSNYNKTEDKLRQDMHLVSIDRTAGRSSVAVLNLRECLLRYGSLSEAEALKAWLEVLSPANSSR